jgi:hypothetical protein
MKVGLASSSCLFEKEVVVFLEALDPEDFSDLDRIDAFDTLDLVVFPATDYFIDLPPILDFLVNALDCRLEPDLPVLRVLASSSPPTAISSSSSSQPCGSISINKSTASKS